MVKDYGKYEFVKSEKIIFYGVGYTCFFLVVYLFYHSIILSAFAGLIVVPVRPRAEAVMAARQRARLELQFKDMLYSLSASVAAGRQMAEAIVEAEVTLSDMYDESEPIMIELRHMKVNILENKESDKNLLQELAARSHSEDINNFVGVYLTCRSMGGNLEKVISHSAQVITDKMGIEKEIRVLTNQKKIEGRIVAAMPIGMLLIMNVTAYSYIEPLYESVIGRLVMTGALASIAVGVYLMEKLSDIEV